MVLGMGAALLEGAPVATQDLDVWFEHVDDAGIRAAAEDAGGFWISGFGVQPPAFGGSGLDRVDVVLTAHGLESFDTEYADSVVYRVDGVDLHVLPLHRIIESKRTIGRGKDLAQLPILEATLEARRGG
jgi:hypothetical protein